MRLAIFDLDGTVLSGNSWHEFFRNEIGRRPGRAPALLGALLLRRLGILSGLQLRGFALGGLRGLDVEGLQKIGRDVYSNRLARLVRPRACQEIERRRAGGYEIVIATGAFDFVARSVAHELGIKRVAASVVAFESGLCQGRLNGGEAVGQCKVAALRDMLARETVDWEASCAFSDELTDIALFSLVGERIFVSKDRLPSPSLPPGTRVEAWD